MLRFGFFWSKVLLGKDTSSSFFKDIFAKPPLTCGTQRNPEEPPKHLLVAPRQLRWLAAKVPKVQGRMEAWASGGHFLPLSGGRRVAALVFVFRLLRSGFFQQNLQVGQKLQSSEDGNPG